MEKLNGRDKVQPHIIANKVNEIIDILDGILESINKSEEKKDA